MSLISIIIPTYNRAHIIEETLLSVLNQTYSNWECIVIDDYSNDKTGSLVKAFINKDNRFLYVKRPKNSSKGANACRNYGKTICKGEFVLFLDSDDILLDTCLEKRLNIFKENEYIDFVIANTSYYKNNGYGKRPICEFPEVYDSEDYLKLFLSYKIPWTIMGVLWRKETIDNITFEEELSRFQDLDFHVKVLLNKSLKSIRIPQIDNYYRVDDDKIDQESFRKNTLKALVFFNNSQKKALIKSEYYNWVKIFNFEIISQFYLSYPTTSSIEIKGFIYWALKSKLYNFKQKAIFRLLILMIFFNLFKYKNIGIYRFNKFFKKMMLK